MKVVVARCHICGKSFLVTEVNKVFTYILKNPNYLFQCEQCAYQIQSEARRERYHEIFHSDETA